MPKNRLASTSPFHTTTNIAQIRSYSPKGAGHDYNGNQVLITNNVHEHRTYILYALYGRAAMTDDGRTTDERRATTTTDDDGRQ